MSAAAAGFIRAAINDILIITSIETVKGVTPWLKLEGAAPVGGRPYAAVGRKDGTSVYKRIIIGILIIGGLFLLNRLYLLWEIHGDMEATVKQEEELTEENQALKAEKDKLIDPEELINRARTQFGLVKQGEIPYKQ